MVCELSVSILLMVDLNNLLVRCKSALNVDLANEGHQCLYLADTGENFIDPRTMLGVFTQLRTGGIGSADSFQRRGDERIDKRIQGAELRKRGSRMLLSPFGARQLAAIGEFLTDRDLSRHEYRERD